MARVRVEEAVSQCSTSSTFNLSARARRCSSPNLGATYGLWTGLRENSTALTSCLLLLTALRADDDNQAAVAQDALRRTFSEKAREGLASTQLKEVIGRAL